MSRNGFILPVVLAVALILGIIIGGFYIFRSKTASKPNISVDQINLATSTPFQKINTPSLSPSPEITQKPSAIPKTFSKKIHLYPGYGADPNINANNIHIISLLFRPKNIETQLKEEWIQNLDRIDGNIKSFFERQFEDNIDITYDIVPNYISGDKNIEEYHVIDMINESKEKTSNLVMVNSYNVWMIYLVRDPQRTKDVILENLSGGSIGLGGFPTAQAATEYEFWLDNEAVNTGSQNGLKGSAHEFGHTLGIPHPWELPANTSNDPNYGNIPGDLMGYQYSGTSFDKLYIRDDVKRAMGL